MLDVKKCVKNCMDKYNLDKEEALRIATTDNILLNINELRMKYNNDKIGTDYPSWITPIEHLKMCYATVWRKYNNDFFWYNSVDDVAYDLFVYSSIRINTYRDEYHLNGLLLCRLKNLIRDYMQEQKICYNNSYDWEVESDEDDEVKYSQAYKYNAVTNKIENTSELILTIKSIRNEKVKGILLVCGYFLANIQEFLEPLVDYYNKCSTKIQDKIYDLGRDDFYFCHAINKDVDCKNKDNVTVGRVLKIFGKRDKAYLTTDLLPYLKNIGIVI